MEYADVNILLKRTLKSGEKYNRYFKNSSCTPSYLGTGDTAFTVSQMKAWANKNAGQTKELAIAEFSKRNLRDTASSIYDFLYNHIQYELDGRRQNLKGPACAWATRAAGTDCKSYSIFASTILINLGIKHYYRRIKQPGMLPENWTHVYVIIPKDQKKLKTDSPSDYYLIDATVHDNQEVRFTQKSDTLMSRVSLPQYGLQSPAPQGLAGCVCTPKAPVAPVVRERPTTLSSVNATRRDVTTSSTRPQGTVANTRPEGTVANTRPTGTTANTRTVTPNTVTVLRSNSVAPIVSAAPSATRSNIVAVSSGTPGSRTATSTSRTSAPAVRSNLTVNPAVTTIVRSSGAASRGTAIERPLPALKGGMGFSIPGNGEKIATGAVNIAGHAAAAGTAGALIAVASAIPVYGQALAVLGSLIGKETINNTIGAVFANNFNISCWGSASSKAKEKKIISDVTNRIKAQWEQATVGNLEAVLNDISHNITYQHQSRTLSLARRGWANCTEKGWAQHVKSFKELETGLIDNVVSQLIAAGWKVSVSTQSVPQQYLEDLYEPTVPQDNTTAEKNGNITIKIYSLQQPYKYVDPQAGASNNLPSFANSISQAGFGATGALIVAALLGGAYMYKNS